MSTVLAPTQMQLMQSDPQPEQSARAEAQRSESAKNRLRAGFDVQWLASTSSPFPPLLACVCVSVLPATLRYCDSLARPLVLSPSYLSAIPLCGALARTRKTNESRRERRARFKNAVSEILQQEARDLALPAPEKSLFQTACRFLSMQHSRKSPSSTPSTPSLLWCCQVLPGWLPLAP